MNNVKYILRQYLYNQLNKSSYTIFWASIVLYSFGYLFLTSEHVPNFLCRLLMAIGLAGLFYSIFKLARLKINNSYFRFVFFIFTLRQLYIAMQGFYGFNYVTLSNFLFSPYLFLHYFVPLIILIPVNIFFYKKTIYFFSFLAVLLFSIFFLFSNELLHTNSNFSEQTVWTLGTGAGFIIMTWSYHSKSIKIISILAVLLSLFIATVMARRNIMLTFSNYILFSILIILFSSSQSFKSKIYIFIFIILIAFTGYYFFNEYQDKLFDKISNHLTEQSRELVFVSYFNDMSVNDLIFGKGFNGTYYCPGVEPDRDYRYLIESGYLQIILKGGIISLVLFLIIAIPAAYLGIVRSNNILSRAAGSIVLLWLIDMAPWGMAAINIRYILLWICIGICFSDEIRSLSDNEINNSLKILGR